MASAASGINYKFTTRFEILDGGNGTTVPVVLESWELYGCYLKAADYGAMSYGSNEAVTVSMTIAYDNAGQIGPNGLTETGVGGTIGRTVGDVVTGVGAAPGAV
jgi:hypothetical protein